VAERNEEALRASDARFRGLLDAAPDAMVIADRSGRIVFANRQAQALFGYAVDELVGQPIEALIPEGYRARHVEHRNQYVGTPRTRAMGAGLPLLARRKDGTEFPVEISLSPMETPEGLLVSAAVRDVTERRQIEARLRASDARFRGLLDAAPDAMVIADRGGRIVLANRQAQTLFGYDPDEMIGQPIEALIPESYRGGHVHHRERYVANPHTRPMGVGLDLIARRKDGTEFPVEISLSPLETPEGLLVSAAIRDVTSRKRIEAQVRALNEDLERRLTELAAVNRELEAFSYSVSHDLRTPLRSIDGFSQALLEEYDDKLDDQGRDYLNRVRAAATRMGELIDDLLDLSRVTRREMRREPLDLSALGRAAGAALERLHPDRRVAFDVQEGLRALGDAHLLRIVLDNLLANAWKFSSKSPVPRVTFGVTKPAEGGRTFFVSDNGVGFDMAHADKLFGAFQRLHAMHEFPGTGIGLATVQRIIARHGGRVWAESTPGAGATFSFTLEDTQP
jgi:PAS domain S-box-containing protein